MCLLPSILFDSVSNKSRPSLGAGEVSASLSACEIGRRHFIFKKIVRWHHHAGGSLVVNYNIRTSCFGCIYCIVGPTIRLRVQIWVARVSKQTQSS